ncbi:MAG: lasso peptide biosynthesis B2 protein [Clostridium sp.]
MQSLLVLNRKLITFIKIDNKTKFDFLVAYIYCGIARTYIRFMPFNKLRKKMGKSKEESSEVVGNETYKLAKRISWIVVQAAKYTPWESKCLVQALTAQRMLKRLGICTTLYLGVNKDSQNNILAHAWLRCGEYIVTGGSQKGGYVVVAKFSNS